MMRIQFFFTAAMVALSILSSGCADSAMQAGDAPKMGGTSLGNLGAFNAGTPSDATSGYTAAPESAAPDTVGGATSPITLVVSPDATTQPAAVGRLIIYSGALNLVVTDVASTLEAIHQLAISDGGYMDEMTASEITVRVPAAKFDPVVAAVAKMGEVTKSPKRCATWTFALATPSRPARGCWPFSPTPRPSMTR
jgi:hypothetical protein